MLRNASIPSVVIFCLAVLAAAPVLADEICLKDGTIIRGLVSNAEDGIIAITPGYNADGSVKVFKFQMSDVLSFSTDEPIYVGTASVESAVYDSVVYGRVEPSSTGVRIVTSTGISTTPISQIKAAWRTQTDSPHERARRKLERHWALELATDLKGRQGNTNLLGTSISFAAVNAGQDDSLSFYTRYNYYRTGGKRSTDDLSAGSDYRANVGSHLLWYVRTNDGFNKINGIAFFSESGVGTGFYFIKEEKHKLELRLGVGFRYETYTKQASEELREAGLDCNLRYEYEWAWGRIGNYLTYMPAFNNFGNYLIRHEAFLEFPIAKSENWKVRFGISNDYNSRPLPGVKKLDTTYGVRLVIQFK
jgi:putative salt-induced outer membrane protein YdiY